MIALRSLAAVCMITVCLNAAVDFDTAIRPVLATHCSKCHGDGVVMSDFDMTSRGSLLRGGKSGSVIVPGDADSSRLYQFVSQGKMPPGQRLEAASISALRDWINEGAKWSGADRLIEAKRAGRSFWAFQPPVKRDPPIVPGVEHPIDRFLGAALRDKGLDFAPQADHRTLIRRLWFDLAGLPPSPEGLGLSYAGAVDRLLASPRYGERWARHWLDVVRYGETDGGEHNNERFNAWPYRDWVIEALNRDMPYDEFVREQIAGDILAPDDPKRVAATGFLTAGPWDSVSAVLNKDETLKQQARMDELDDMVTTVAHTFLALTVNCARCHDHKFDPIPARDYYRMTGFFAGVGFGDREVATTEERARRDAFLKPLRAEADQIRKELSGIEDPIRTALLEERYRAFDNEWSAEPRRIPVNPIYNRNGFPQVSSKFFRFVVTAHQGKRARIDSLELRPAGHKVSNWTSDAEATADKPAYLPFTFDEPGQVDTIVFSSDRKQGSRDGSVTVYRFDTSDDGVSWRPIASSLDHVGRNELDLPEVPEAEFVAALTPDARARRASLLEEQRKIQARMDQGPAVAKLYATKPRDVEKTWLLDRGDVKRRVEEVAPGVLSCLGGDVPPDTAEGARRLALANWIANAANPLTARVIVNRVWYYHFGNGLVNTPSDFGFNGDRPSHPELLDWLAVSFVENGWSLKWLHRLILTSRAYQQSSRFDQKAFDIDAGNRLVWRMPLKRMDAETMRDSILAATGNLDLRMGGPSFFLQKKGPRGSYIYAALANDGPEVWRRSVYRFVVRGGDRIMLDSFDCPDPSVATPQRSSSNTPVQALTLLNNPFVLRQAELLAQRLDRESPDNRDEQIRRAYALLYQRPPSSQELSRDRRFVDVQPLSIYCRVLLNSNEFVYVP